MQSMTGFGRSRASIHGRAISVEVRSVNHRYCDVSSKLPARYSTFEPEVAKLVRTRFERGKFDLTLREEWGADASEELMAARRAYSVLKRIKGNLKISGPISLSDLLEFQGLQKTRMEPTAGWHGACRRLVVQALKGLKEMRAREGRHLSRWFRGRIHRMRRALREVERGLEAATRIRGESSALETGVTGPDRSDVTEEIVRLKSHFSQFERFLSARETVGRKLDFLSQEMLRELNTLGAKVPEARLAHRVIDLKSDMEKIREQVQNIE